MKSGIQPNRDGMKNVPASYKRNRFMKKLTIYKITFESCWKSLPLGQKFEIDTCEIAKTLSLQIQVSNSRFFQLVLAKILGRL